MEEQTNRAKLTQLIQMMQEEQTAAALEALEYLESNEFQNALNSLLVHQESMVPGSIYDQQFNGLRNAVSGLQMLLSPLRSTDANAPVYVPVPVPPMTGGN